MATSRRYNFIPPHKRPSPSAYRPATVAEVLDAGGPDEGYRYRVLYAGQSMEMFTQPGTRLLEVGELVIPRIVRGAGELFLPMPRQAAEVLYIAANVSDDGNQEIWSYDGSSDPVQEVIIPSPHTEWVTLTSLCWCRATQSLWIGISDIFGPHFWIFEWKPGDAAAVVRIDDYNNPDYPICSDPPIDWAEWGGYLYVLHSGQFEVPAWVMRFDPANPAGWGKVCDITSGAENIGEGGFLVFANRIYAMSSENIWYSDTGAAGTWVELTDLPDDHSTATASGAVTDPVSGYGYFVALSTLDWTTREIWRLEADGTLTKECSDAKGDQWAQFDQIAIPYGDMNMGPLALQWYASTGPNTIDIYRRDAGTWALEEAFVADTDYERVGANQAALYFKKKLHIMTYDSSGENHVHLRRRDSIGNWTTVKTWSPCHYGETYHYGLAMTLGKTARYVQNI